MENTILLKAGRETGIRFELKGTESINTEQLSAADILCRISAVRPAGMLNACFYKNLLKIDSNLPLMYMRLVYLYYQGKGQAQGVKELVRILAEENVIGFPEKWVYEDKLQKLLVEAAYGMNPASDWDGGYRQIIKSIVLEKEGKTYRFSGGEKESFGQFLMENSKIYGIGKEDGFETVYERNGRYYINLAANIVI